MTSKIYTKTGDKGETGLFAGPRVPKCHLRIEATGDVDELNAILGVTKVADLPKEVEPLVSQIQHDLFAVGAEMATPKPAEQDMVLLQASHVKSLEQAIDRFDQQVPPLRQFILPGGTSTAAQLHLARTVCRRAERRVVELAQSPDAEPVSPFILEYLNRLSDLLFVLARFVNEQSGEVETPWQKPAT